MYVVIGGGGFLGSYVVKHILSDTHDCVTVATRSGQTAFADNKRVTAQRFDACEPSDIRSLCSAVSQHESVKIIYLCAQHNIDIVAREPKKSFMLNITALQNFVDTIKNVKCLFFASSDTVYGEGGQHRFTEDEPLSPVSIYGKHKVLGEELVLSHGYNVLRLPFMFGKSLSPYKKHFYDTVSEKLLNSRSVSMFTDSVRSTLSFDTVAQTAVFLCENYQGCMPKIVNVAGDEALSKYDVGLRLADSLGVSRSLIVPALSAGSYEPGAQRAVSTLMDNSLLKQITADFSLNHRSLDYKFCL